MAEPIRTADGYLRELSTRLTGSRRTRARLLAEIRDHLDDSIVASVAAGVEPALAEHEAVGRLGAAETLTDAWEARCSRLRARRRRHVALLAGVAAVASVLGVAQHADGRRDPTAPVRLCSPGPSRDGRPCPGPPAARPREHATGAGVERR